MRSPQPSGYHLGFRNVQVVRFSTVQGDLLSQAFGLEASEDEEPPWTVSLREWRPWYL